MNLAERIDKFPTIKRDHCVDCGNPWHFDEIGRFRCTTCGRVTEKASATEQLFRRSPCEHGIPDTEACAVCDGDHGAFVA